jgi:hypothetical protein
MKSAARTACPKSGTDGIMLLHDTSAEGYRSQCNAPKEILAIFLSYLTNAPSYRMNVNTYLIQP